MEPTYQHLHLIEARPVRQTEKTTTAQDRHHRTADRDDNRVPSATPCGTSPLRTRIRDLYSCRHRHSDNLHQQLPQHKTLSTHHLPHLHHDEHRVAIDTDTSHQRHRHHERRVTHHQNNTVLHQLPHVMSR